MTRKQKFGVGFLAAAGLLFPAAAGLLFLLGFGFWVGLVAVLWVSGIECALVGVFLGYQPEGD